MKPVFTLVLKTLGVCYELMCVFGQFHYFKHLHTMF